MRVRSLLTDYTRKVLTTFAVASSTRCHGHVSHTKVTKGERTASLLRECRALATSTSTTIVHAPCRHEKWIRAILKSERAPASHRLKWKRIHSERNSPHSIYPFLPNFTCGTVFQYFATSVSLRIAARRCPVFVDILRPSWSDLHLHRPILMNVIAFASFQLLRIREGLLHNESRQKYHESSYTFTRAAFTLYFAHIVVYMHAIASEWQLFY